MNGKEESPGYIETILNELQGKTPLNAGCLPETEMEEGGGFQLTCHLSFSLWFFFDQEISLISKISCQG